METEVQTKIKCRLKTRYVRLLSDTFSPVSVYLNVRDRFPNSILLESSDYHTSENSFSYVCFDPVASFSVKDENVTVRYRGDEALILHAHANEIKNQLSDFISSFETETLPFSFSYNGLFGYINYDAVSYFEKVNLFRTDDAETPDIFYQVYRYVLVIHHFKNEAFLFEHLQEDEISGIDEIKKIITASQVNTYRFSVSGDEFPFTSETEFLRNTYEAINHCKKGDVFQLVLSRRFKIPFSGDEFNVYRVLRSVSPSPYLFYFDMGNFKLAGSSPEAQLVTKNKKAIIRPIAGTFKRTGDDEKDRLLAEALLNDPKENAEHNMLVDLARNDLSRNGSGVSVDAYREVQFFSHVIHLVSEVSAQLNNDNRVAEIIADTFPAGTLTGAPKVKAMELITRYEKHNRGFYGGCIGFIGFDGTSNHAIMIRTFLSAGNEIFYQAGAGIVESSVPENELKEIDNKLRALRTAIQNAQQINQ